MQDGNLEGEISQLRAMTQLQPKDHKAYNDLGVALTKAKRYPDAITAFEKAIALCNGDYPEAHNNLGLVLLQTGVAGPGGCD